MKESLSFPPASERHLPDNRCKTGCTLKPKASIVYEQIVEVEHLDLGLANLSPCLFLVNSCIPCLHNKHITSNKMVMFVFLCYGQFFSDGNFSEWEMYCVYSRLRISCKYVRTWVTFGISCSRVMYYEHETGFN